MLSKKRKIFAYGIIAVFVSIISMGQVNADVYENYYGIEITNNEYNTLINLGFSEEEIYYMTEDTYLENKDLDATLVAKNSKYYKTTYTDLDGYSYTTEITAEEYENQPTINARGVVSTAYKEMISTLSQNGNKFRYKVSLLWKNMPERRSFDIIGIGFDDPVFIDSSVYFNFHWCNSSGSCTTDSSYYNKKKTSTGGSAVYDLPDNAYSLTTTLYYDVSKNTSNTITNLTMYADYAHATSNVSQSSIGDYDITRNGIELWSSIGNKYDAIPCAESYWNGTW